MLVAVVLLAGVSASLFLALSLSLSFYQSRKLVKLAPKAKRIQGKLAQALGI